jgi:hypothetical protein
MSFEVLHLALMPLGRGARLEGAEISAALCLRIEFAGIQPILARAEFPYHDPYRPRSLKKVASTVSRLSACTYAHTCRTLTARPLGAPLISSVSSPLVVACVSANVLTIVLIPQNRHLDLQISLLTERKVTKVIHLMEGLWRDMPMVKDRDDAQATFCNRRPIRPQWFPPQKM